MSRKAHRNLSKSRNRAGSLGKTMNRHMIETQMLALGERWSNGAKSSSIERKPGDGLMKSRKRQGYSPIMKFGTLAH